MKNLIRAEFMKIFKRLNVWVMLFLLLLFQNIPVIIAFVREFGQASLYYLPRIFTTQLSTASTTSSLIGILILVLTVSSLGGEYGWGTLRTVLIRGTSRYEFISAKFVAILCVLLFWFVSLLLLSLLLGWGLMVKMKQEISWNFFNFSGGLTLLAYLAMAYYTVIPTVVLGFFWTVIGRSLGVGMGASIVHVVVADPLIFQLFRSLGGFWSDLSPYTLTALGRSVATFGLDVSLPLPFLSNQSLAALALFVYIFIFGAAAMKLFQRSDIRFTAA